MCFSSILLAFSSPVFGVDNPVNFNRDIRPLLSDRCFHCHGPDNNKRKADLRLDTREGALAPLDKEGKTFTLVPGHPDKSELYYRITTDDEDDHMPPTDSKLPKLTEAEKDLIKKWIEQGVNFSDLWSFVPVEKPDIPEPEGEADWPKNGIDHFVLKKLEQQKMEPSPEADRNTLIRRLSFDITGLPPTVEELDGFLTDKSPNAYEKVVDRLLASNRYGERMAVEWMDAARYADTSGFQYDWFRTMWRWRDWVIDSYNANQPYDEFVTWQLAGDLLPNATIEQKVATGFNRNHPFTIEGGVIDEEYRIGYVSDRVTTMGTVFMGLTLECSRCHDHKFDPVSQKDFYQLFAFFNNLPEKGLVGGKPLFGPPAIAAPTREQTARLTQIEKEIKSGVSQLMKDDPKLDLAQLDWGKNMSSPWTSILPVTMATIGESKFVKQEDNSLLLEGKIPAKDRYDLTIQLPQGVATTGFRIEALTHSSMKGNGPGRSRNGNAVLSEIEAVAIDKAGKERKLSLSKAVADYEQKGFTAAFAIDRKAGTGWAFDGNTNHADHSIAVTLTSALKPETDLQIKIRLRFESQYSGHSFGCVRVALSSIPDPAGSGSDDAHRKILAKLPAKRTPTEAQKLKRRYRERLPQFRAVATTLTKLEKEQTALKKSIPMTMIMSDAKPRETFILERGAYDKPMGKVVAATPENLPSFPEGAPQNRLGLAQWMTARNHPLTARVTVNRLWYQIFGVGIVKTVNDFGSQAEWPSHPELLDWLAAGFMDSGWDMKAMIKLIVTSSTYRQSSNTSAKLLDYDPENRLLARGPRNRMSAEMIRDNALAVSGLLSLKIGGPSSKPYQPPGLWKELTNRKNYQHVYEPDSGDGLYRRGLYTYWKRAAHHPMMSTFDAPNREVCTASRGVTNTPLQALLLLHDPQFVEAARQLAVRLHRESNDVSGRIRKAYRIVLARDPSASEMALLKQLHQEELATLQANPDEAEKVLSVGASPVPDKNDPVALAATTFLTRAILNVSESITKH